MKDLKHCTRHPGHRSCEDKARLQQEYERILASWERPPNPEQGFWIYFVAGMVVVFVAAVVVAPILYWILQ